VSRHVKALAPSNGFWPAGMHRMMRFWRALPSGLPYGWFFETDRSQERFHFCCSGVRDQTVRMRRARLRVFQLHR